MSTDSRLSSPLFLVAPPLRMHLTLCKNGDKTLVFAVNVSIDKTDIDVASAHAKRQCHEVPKHLRIGLFPLTRARGRPHEFHTAFQPATSSPSLSALPLQNVLSQRGTRRGRVAACRSLEPIIATQTRRRGFISHV